MSTLTRALALFLLVGVISCGESDSVNGLKSGFYVAEGDLTKKSYPLVIVTTSSNKVSLYQISLVNTGVVSTGGLGAGTSVKGESREHLGTEVLGIEGDPYSYFGTVVKSGADLRMRAYRTTGSAFAPEEIATKAEVLDDYTMKSVTKEKAIEAARSLLKPRAAGEAPYSKDQEKVCKGAFSMTCAELIP